MTYIFIDTNVLMDLLADRKPFSHEASLLFKYAYEKRIILYISAVSYNNLYYILRQHISHTESMKMLSELSEWVEIIDVTSDIIRHSLRSNFKDFEDAIQYECAKSNPKVQCIVTRNEKDFRRSTIPILTPHEVVSALGS